MNTRRHLIQSLLAGAALAPFSAFTRLAVAAPAAGADSRFVFVMLRGGLDGLTAAPAIGDPAFASARGMLGDFKGFATPPLRLDDTFALHPLLPQVHAMHGRGEMSLLHAIGLPYRERSHFDAQQVLESGGARPWEMKDGWLGRAVAASSGKGAGAPTGGLRAVALETAVPLVLRGPSDVDTWAPSVLPEPSADLVTRLATVYRSDPELAQALQRARGLRDGTGLMADAATKPEGAAANRNQTVTLATKAAEFLQRGSRIAVLDISGWDSHANQGAPNAALSNNLRTLDAALAALRAGLLPNDAWKRTVVVVATEFGREVAVNGTAGTDHGSGGAAFVLGGAVRGGRVLADWPGLAPAQRHEGRDLRVTTDLRAVFRTVLVDHLQLSARTVEQSVLPGSAALPPMALLRG
ncbi:MAG: DUF1501 domain-containing protein [Rubrivivax sp.]